MSLCLTVIVPRLPPLIDGVGDYALALAQELRAKFGIGTRFVVTDPEWECNQVQDFRVHRLHEHTAKELFEVLPQEGTGLVLLHYVGYAYAKRGCPMWLVEGLEDWRNASSENRVLTLFHELYASGPPWTSSFWLARYQRGLARRLARISEANLTSLDLYAQRLAQMGSSAVSLPVFSSIGEPSHLPPPLPLRRRRIVVFGNNGRRALVYRRSAEALNRICRELQIEEIWDIGRGMDIDARALTNLHITFCGELPGPEVGEILLDSVAGVIDYPTDMLSKSTVFAAFGAHRVLPLVAGYGSADDADGLIAGVQFQLVNDEKKLDPSSAQQIADNAFEWYQTHTLATHTQRLAARLDCVRPVTREALVHA